MMVDEALSIAAEEWRKANYRRGVEALQPFAGVNDVAPRQAMDVSHWLSRCYRFLFDFKTALPHGERSVQLARSHWPRSREHAVALKEVSMVHRGLKDFPAAREAIVEAQTIMEEHGLQTDETYGAILSALGSLDYFQGRYREAEVTYGKAKAVLARYKLQREYGVLLGSMAVCHRAQQKWDEAVALYKEAAAQLRGLHGSGHPEYATTLHNLADTHAKLDQFHEAILCFQEALVIYERVYGVQHARTIETSKALAQARSKKESVWNDRRDVAVAGVAHTALVPTVSPPPMTTSPRDWRDLRLQPLPVRFFALAQLRLSKVAYQFCEGETWLSVTWGEWTALVKTLACAMLASNFSKGDRALIVSETRAEWGSLSLAVQACGGVAVVVPPTLDAEQLREVCEQTAPLLAFVDEMARLDKLLAHRSALSSIRHMVCVHKEPPSQLALSWRAFLDLGKVESFSARLTQSLNELRLEDVATVHYSDNRLSASHRRLRGVRISLGNEAFAADAYTDALKMTSRDRVLCLMPYADACSRALCLHQSINSGCVLFYGGPLENLHRNLMVVQPSVIYSAPVLWQRFEAVLRLKLGSADPAMLAGGVKEKLRKFIGCGSVRFTLSSTAAIHPQTVSFFGALGIRLRNLYAKASLSGVCTLDLDSRGTTSGKPLPGIEVKVVDGELQVKGPNVSQGCWGQPDTGPPDWTRTGDDALLDDHGALVVQGSIANCLRLKCGTLIHPELIELELRVSNFSSFFFFREGLWRQSVIPHPRRCFP
jgi:long-chain acyl-CoA synthetase